MTPSKQTIGYLSHYYGCASDKFIRVEVRQLRKLGFNVQTFSIRAPDDDELVGTDVLRERQATEDLLGAGVLSLIGNTVFLAMSRFGRFAQTLSLAIRISTPGLRGRLWPMAYVVEACFLAQRMQGKGVQHLHAHNGYTPAAVAMFASLLSGIPYSLTIHGSTEFDTPLTLALNEKIGRSKFTVAISGFGRSQLMRWSGAKHWHKIHVVRCGVSCDFKSALISDVPDVPRIVCVASLIEQKGHLLLLDALARLANDDLHVELTLIGDGPLRSEIEAAIIQHGLQRQVTLLGWQSTSEVIRIIQASRAFVLASFAEGLPVSLMEAMALARPVISANVGAVSELIEHGKHGWLFTAGTVDELKEDLREMLETPVARLTEMGRVARAHVVQRHDAGQKSLKPASLIMDKS